MTVRELLEVLTGAQRILSTSEGQALLQYLEESLYTTTRIALPDEDDMPLTLSIRSMVDFAPDPYRAIQATARADLIRFLRDVAERGAELVSVETIPPVNGVGS